MKVIAILLFANMLFGYSSSNKWDEREKEQTFMQTLDVVNLYTEGVNKPISKSSKENLEVTMCTLKKIVHKYSYENYFNALSDNKYDNRPEVFELKKFRFKALKECNIKFNKMSYTILVIQGLIKPEDVPKDIQ